MGGSSGGCDISMGVHYTGFRIQDFKRILEGYGSGRLDALHRRIARNIRARAEARGILITHLPDRAGVGRSSFFNVMRGRSSPTVRWLVKVAHALGCELADLF